MSDNNTQTQKIYPFDLLTLWLVTTSLASMALLAMHHFKALHAIILGTIGMCLILQKTKRELMLRDNRFAWGILIIMLLALLFRAQPALWVGGGQDQGIYVNMSASMERNGSMIISDPVRPFADTSDALKFFDKNNQLDRRFHLPGIFQGDTKKSQYLFQFYHLHPAWMAIFAQIFGSDMRVWSLVLFSLISIVAMYLIAVKLSGGRRLPGLLTAGLLAINPLHAFFSKYPVSEITALAFVSTGFYYLLRYVTAAREGRGRRLDLALSLGLFTCLFFTRISGFLYIPFFYLVALIVRLTWAESKYKSHLMRFFAGLLFCYVLSVIYGLVYAWPYAWGTVYQQIFAFIFRPIGLATSWPLFFAIGGVFLVVVFKRASHKGSWLNQRALNIFASTHQYLFLSLVGLLSLGFLRTIQVAVKNDGPFFPSLLHSQTLVAILFLSPFGFVLWAASWGRGRTWVKDNPLIAIVYLFNLLFAVYLFVLHGRVNGLYYSARYQLSEFVPFAILILSLFVDYLWQQKEAPKKLVIGMLSGMIIFSLYFTGCQLKGRSGEGMHSALSQVAKVVDQNDLLLLQYHHSTLKALPQLSMTTALAHYYGLNVMNVQTLNDFEDFEHIVHVMKYFNDVYVLSLTILSEPFFTSVDEIAYRVGMFAQGSLGIPDQYIEHKQNANLYKVDRLLFTQRLFLQVLNEKKMIMTQLSPRNLENFHHDRVWTKGDSAVTGLNYKVEPEDRQVVVHTHGKHPLLKTPNAIALKVFVNDIPAKPNHYAGGRFIFDLPPSLDVIKRIGLKSSTFVPEEIPGTIKDTRTLGIDVAGISIQPSQPS